MSDDYCQLVAKQNKEINITAKAITAMLIMGQDKHIVTADRQTSKLQLHSYPDFKLLNERKLKNTGLYGIVDMTLIDSDTFAILVPGIWTNGTLCIFKIDKENFEIISRLKIGKSTFGLCFQKDFFFLTCSPSNFFKKTGNGYVKMVSKDGEIQKEFTVDKKNKLLFGNPLSRIHVDKNFRMFVSDSEKKELIILKIDPINREVTELTRHKYSVKDIATKLDGTCFLVTSHQYRVVLLHANGEWVFNNFLPCSSLNDKPLSVTFNETDKQLLVVTQRSNWYSLWKKCLVIFVFDVKKKSHCEDISVTTEN